MLVFFGVTLCLYGLAYSAFYVPTKCEASADARKIILQKLTHDEALTLKTVATLTEEDNSCSLHLLMGISKNCQFRDFQNAKSLILLTCDFAKNELLEVPLCKGGQGSRSIDYGRCNSWIQIFFGKLSVKEL